MFIKRSAALLAAMGAVALTTSGTAVAEIYKWVDREGVVNYSSSPPPNGRTTRVITEEKVSTVEATPISAAEAEALNSRIAARQKATGEVAAAAPTGGSGGVGGIPTTEPIVEQRVYYPAPRYSNQTPRWRHRDRKPDYVIGPGPYGVGGQAVPVPREPRRYGVRELEER